MAGTGRSRAVEFGKAGRRKRWRKRCGRYGTITSGRVREGGEKKEGGSV